VPGLFARGRIQSETAHGIVLSAAAAYERDGRTFDDGVTSTATARVNAVAHQGCHPHFRPCDPPSCPDHCRDSGVIAFRIFALARLQTDEFPDIEAPVVAVASLAVFAFSHPVEQASQDVRDAHPAGDSDDLRDPRRRARVDDREGRVAEERCSSVRPPAWRAVMRRPRASVVP
jgi:hypothetical protein